MAARRSNGRIVLCLKVVIPSPEARISSETLESLLESACEGARGAALKRLQNAIELLSVRNTLEGIHGLRKTLKLKRR